MGFRLYCRNSPIILERALVCVCCHQLLYKVDKDSAVKKYDPQGSDKFVQEHIVHQFGIPQTLTTDQGASFMSHQFKEFACLLKIKLLNSSPYYGQAESSNKTLIKFVKKKIEGSPRRWHEVLLEALWARSTSKYGATKVTPFELVYGQEGVQPVEINKLITPRNAVGF
jgi:transposase InsO family protein